jgi:hypothetical protein
MPNAVVVCHPLSSFPVKIRRLILHAVVVVCCRCLCRCLCLPRHCPPPLLSAAAAAISFCRSHHCHSAVSTISCHLILSFLTIVPCLILHAVIVRHRHCLPPLSAAFAIIICHRRLPLPQPSLPLRCLCYFLHHKPSHGLH